MNRIFLIFAALLVAINLHGQVRTITGQVKDQTGETLISATVVVQTESGASQTGTTTDLDGNFTLNIPEGSNSLFISYIGYESKVVDITGLTEVEIILNQSTTQLEDVVVTALGIKKEKKALGYAFSDVKGEELTTNRDVNFINSISNKVAGVNISQTAGGAGTSSRIVIRGIKSLSTESQPLIVVDGVPMDNASDGASWLGGLDYGNALMGISPDDIETMSVLKGPNAAALYGSRAATGVILITTRKGTERDRLRVTLNTNFMIDRAYLVADYQNEYGAGFSGAIQYQALSESQQEEHGVDSAYYYYSTGSWGPKMDGTMEVLNWNNEFYTLTPQPNNVSDYFNQGYTLTNSVAVENGSEKFNWRFSASALNNSGLKPNSTYNRKTVNYNMNSKLNEMFSLSFKANYIREDAFNRVGQGDARTGARTFIWMPRSINTNTLRDDHMSDNGYEQNWYFASDWHTNPYWEAYENYNNDNKDQFTGYGKIDMQITPWLKGFIRSSMDTYTSKRYLRIANNALRANGEGAFTERWVNYRSLNHDFLLTAEKNFGDDLNLMVHAGGNYYNYAVDYQSSSIVGLAVPNFFSLNNPKYPAETSVGTSKREKVIQSFYGSAQLNYKSWLYTELTARNDWSTTLPLHNNSYFYPSVNSSVVFTELLGMNKNTLSFGKVRFSYAFVGNDTDPYRLSSAYISQQYGDVPAVYLTNERGNPNLKPERTGSWEVGADLRFFMSRVTMDVTYYNETTYDQIVSAEISKASGFAKVVTNGGEISNKGVEIQMNFKPVKSPDLNWDISVNFAKNQNMVLSLAGGLSQLTITNESQIDIVAVPGQPYGEILGTRLARYYRRDDQGNVIDDPNNGKPLIGEDGYYIAEERGVIGNVTPDWTGGITNALRYKELSLSFSIGVQKGGDLFSKTNKYGLDNGQFVETLEGRESWYAATSEEQLSGSVGYVADGVLADGSENTRGIDPQMYWHQRKWGGIAELDVYDATYVKLRDVTLNYNLPSAWFGDGFIQSASLALVGRNLWLIYSGVPNIDPESSFTSNNNGIGQEYAAMPTTRSIGFNLKLVF
ncbi:MAG: SusC/RagA family TonB-linked outer membrane protein [Bacteroidota bacterium]